MRYSIISFDMFQTLVDVNTQKYSVWAEILKESYTKEKADIFWEDMLKKLSEYSSDVNLEKYAFQPMINKFSTCYKKLFAENNIQMDVSLAVNILFREHSRAPIFNDAKELLSQIDSRYFGYQVTPTVI